MSETAPPTPAPAVPAESTLLLRFGELTLKSDAVRRRFTEALRANLEAAFVREGLDCLIRDDFGHLYIDTPDLERAVPILQRTFGLTSVSPAAMLRSSNLDEVAAFLASYALAHLPPGARSFAVRARRTGSHPYASPDVARACGAAIQKLAALRGSPLAVNLKEPDFEVEVEVRENLAYAYARRFPCAGGFPVGTAGKVVCVLRGSPAEADLDARAAWMLVKRGAFPLYLAEGDEPSRTPAPAAAAALARMAAWAPTHKMWVAANPLDPAVLASFARRYNAHAVAIGTRAKGGEVEGAASLLEGYPTFHPLLALTDEEIAKIPL